MTRLTLFLTAIFSYSALATAPSFKSLQNLEFYVEKVSLKGMDVGGVEWFAECNTQDLADLSKNMKYEVYNKGFLGFSGINQCPISNIMRIAMPISYSEESTVNLNLSMIGATMQQQEAFNRTFPDALSLGVPVECSTAVDEDVVRIICRDISSANYGEVVFRTK